MKSNQWLTFAVLVIILILLGCKSSYNYTPLYDEDCPFRRLNFTTSTEKDSLINTVSINDSLVAALESDLQQLKGEGRVGNNLSIAVSKINTSSSERALDVTNEYYQLFNNKTTALCGLNELLKNSKSLSSEETRKRAEDLLVDLIDDLSSFSDKKKDILSQ